MIRRAERLSNGRPVFDRLIHHVSPWNGARHLRAQCPVLSFKRRDADS
jgi:hypothetical protein